MKYYLLSLRNCSRKDKWLTFYGSGMRGYTTTLYNAGEYENIAEFEDNHELLPIEKDKCIHEISITSGGEIQIPNCQAVLDILQLRWSATGLRRKEVKQEAL